MPTSNFLIFDQNKANMIGDEAYQTSTQRLNGVQSGVASSMLNNKFAYQVSLVAYAIAQIMNQNGIDATDTMAVSQFVNNLSSTFLQKVVDKASVEDAIEASSDSKWMSPKTVKSMLQHIGSSWQLLEKWETSGTKTWVAPDLLGNGKPYEIGAFLIGGGGSGAMRTQGNASQIYPATGGSAAQTKITHKVVTPGQSYTIRIGSGGAYVSHVYDYNVFFKSNGNDGGSTQAFSVTALGGYGGVEGSTTGEWFDDDKVVGQMPDWDGYSGGKTNKCFGGSLSFVAEGSNTAVAGKNFLFLRRMNPMMAFNPFEQKKILGAGGYAAAEPSSYPDSYPSYDDDGNVAGGKGISLLVSSGASSTYYAQSGQQPGCGGGGVGFSTSQGYTPTPSLRTGAGASGAVYLYFLKAS